MKARIATLMAPILLCPAISFAAATVVVSSNNTHTVHQHQMTIQQVLTLVERAGYKNIWKIELDRQFYEVKGFNAQGGKIKLKINATNGAITTIHGHD